MIMTVMLLKRLFARICNALANGVLRLLNLSPRLPAKYRRLCEENFDCNRKKEIPAGLPIRDQLTGRESGVSEYSLGHSKMRLTGCEVISVYNALLMLGQPMPMAELTKVAQQQNAVTRFPFVAWGAWGCNPYRLNRVLQACGLRSSTLHSLTGLTVPGVYVISFWNDGSAAAMTGLHTVALLAERDPEGVLRCTTMNFDCVGGELRDLTPAELALRVPGFMTGYQVK